MSPKYITGPQSGNFVVKGHFITIENMYRYIWKSISLYSLLNCMYTGANFFELQNILKT